MSLYEVRINVAGEAMELALLKAMLNTAPPETLRRFLAKLKKAGSFGHIPATMLGLKGQAAKNLETHKVTDLIDLQSRVTFAQLATGITTKAGIQTLRDKLALWGLEVRED